jgi:hypothetical protein
MSLSDSRLTLEDPLREPPRQLADLDGMGEPIVEHMAVIWAHHLRNPGESPEQGAVDDPVPVVLRRGAVVVGLDLLGP